MAGSTGGIKAGQAFVEMYVNDSRLVKGLNAANAKLKAFGNAVNAAGIGLSALGAGIVTPILLAAKSFAATGDALDEMSARVGISATSLSELSYAAGLSGTNLEELEGVLKHMSKNIFEAGQGAQASIDAITMLGLSVSDLMALNPEEQFKKIAGALDATVDPGRKAALALGIFGKSGTTILPMIHDMAALRQQAIDLGAVMSGEDVAAAVKLQDSFDGVKAALQGVANAIGSSVAPLLTEYVQIVARTLAGVSQWIRQNKELVVTALKIGAALLTGGAILIATGIAINFVAATMASMAAILVSGTALASFAFGTLATAVAAILSPLGLFYMAITDIASQVVNFNAILGTLAGAAQRTFSDMTSFATLCFDGIKDALKAGDISLAADILWASLKVTWQQGTEALTEYWIAFSTGLQRVFFGLGFAFYSVVDSMTGYFYRQWNEVIGWFAKKITGLQVILDPSLNADAINKSIDQMTGANSRSSLQGSADLQKDQDEYFAQIGKDRDSGIAAAQAELLQSKRDLGRLLAQAQEGADKVKPLGRSSTVLPLDAIDKATKADVVGTFSGASVGQIGVGTGVFERIAKISDQMFQSLTVIERYAGETASNTSDQSLYSA